MKGMIGLVLGRSYPSLFTGASIMHTYKFHCPYCDSQDLIYKKWVECKEAVIFHADGHIELKKAVIDTDKDLGTYCGFECSNGHQLALNGAIIQDEKELEIYLSYTPKEIQEMDNIYFGRDVKYSEAIEDEIFNTDDDFSGDI